MKAITRKRYGGPEVLQVEDLPRPGPQSDEVLVRVYATTVNRTDCGILTGSPWIIRLFTGLLRPRHLIPGTDFAGVVEAIGSEVQKFAVGDRVWGFNDNGLQSYAQYLCIKADAEIAPIPAGFAYDEAVACIEGGHYAYHFIRSAGVRNGQRVLINGATGAMAPPPCNY